MTPDEGVSLVLDSSLYCDLLPSPGLSDPVSSFVLSLPFLSVGVPESLFTGEEG